ncbi:IS110 family transposase, partial [Candidatus Omnitrophota bacterium]
MYFVGADLHKPSTLFYVLDEHGNKYDTKVVSNSPESLEQYFMKLPKPFVLAVETTYNWYFFVDIAEKYAEKTYLADSYALKGFAKRHKKTDKIDARLIATLLYKGYLPTVTIADKASRNTREFLRYRINLVRDRTRLIARIKTLLDKLGEPSALNLTTYKGLESIIYDHLPSNYQEIISGYIDSIRRITEKVRYIGTVIENQAIQDADIVNLKTIPGLDYFGASLVKSEIIDIDRFGSFNRLCAYAGLAPRVAQSGNTVIHGPLNINRRKYLRWILLETVWHFIRSNSKSRHLYDALEKRKGSGTAKVIMARHMLKVIYHVLKERRPFYQERRKIRSVAIPALS